MQAGLRYSESRERITALVTDLPGSDLDRSVPATPGWTVKDLVAHVVGVPADINSGRFDGVGTARWTQAQVDARRGVALEAVLEEWAALAPGVEALADTSPAVGDPLVGDIACHEHDLRGALTRPGERDSATVDQARQVAMLRLDERLKSADVGGLRLRAAETEWIVGPTEPAATVTTDPFTLFRLLFGRRSRAQMAALAWTGDPAPYLDLLGQYPPAVADLVE